MNVVAEHLLNAALALPDDDRVQFVEALIVSLQPEGGPPVDDSWLAIVKRRSAELKTREAETPSWAEVKRYAMLGAQKQKENNHGT